MERGVILPWKDANGLVIYDARFVDELKKDGTSEAYEKSRFIVQTFSDDADHYMRYSLTTQRLSQRILLCTAHCDPELIMSLRDITQVYTQSEKIIIKRIHIESPQSLNLSPTKLLHVVRPLHGLPESGLFWFETYHSHHTQNISINLPVHDMISLYSWEIFIFRFVRC